MTLKIIALFLMGAAVGYVAWVKIVDLISKLVRDWNMRYWRSE